LYEQSSYCVSTGVYVRIA